MTVISELIKHCSQVCDVRRGDYKQFMIFFMKSVHLADF
jgi:hypothetical protein